MDTPSRTLVDPSDVTATVSDLLEPGERVRWTARPVLPRSLDRQDLWFIVLSGWFVAVAWATVLFRVSGTAATYARVVPLAVELGYVVFARPFVRRWQQRRTTFAVTTTRVIVVRRGPFGRFDAAPVTTPFRAWRRADGCGTIQFDPTPSSRRSRLPSGLRTAVHVVLYLVGLTATPVPPARRDESRLEFFAVADVEAVSRLLSPVALAFDEGISRNRAERSARTGVELSLLRQVAGLAGVLLLVTTVPVIAVRGREYLQDSPTLRGAGTLHLKLAPATYVIFEHPATVGPYDCGGGETCVTITPADVQVIAQGGSAVAVRRAHATTAITDGADHYAAAATFTVRAPGRFTATIRSSVRANFVIAVTPSEEWRALAGWLTGALAGLVLSGMFLVSGVRARGRRMAPLPPPGPAT